MCTLLEMWEMKSKAIPKIFIKFTSFIVRLLKSMSERLQRCFRQICNSWHFSMARKAPEVALISWLFPMLGNVAKTVLIFFIFVEMASFE